MTSLWCKEHKGEKLRESQKEWLGSKLCPRPTINCPISHVKATIISVNQDPKTMDDVKYREVYDFYKN